jgi:hypothetical protein
MARPLPSRTTYPLTLAASRSSPPILLTAPLALGLLSDSSIQCQPFPFPFPQVVDLLVTHSLDPFRSLRAVRVRTTPIWKNLATTHNFHMYIQLK